MASSVLDGQLDRVELLLDAGVSPDTKLGEGGYSLIMLACNSPEISSTSDRTEVVRALLKADADPTVEAKDGSTALSLAQKNKYAEIVRLLREAGAEE